MVELLTSPWNSAFETLLGRVRSTLLVCSPYIGYAPCATLARVLSTAIPRPTIHIVTDLSPDNLLNGATDPNGLVAIGEACPEVSVSYLPRLHAKAYVCDESEAIVTSGNLTESGLSRNHELGVRLSEQTLVAGVKAHLTGLAALGALVDLAHLRELAAATGELRVRWRAAERSTRKSLREAFEQQLGAVNDSLLELRVRGRTVNAVFCETIAFLLRGGSMTTPDLHARIQQLHPDLCDDSVERVISGQRFGKRWKHLVRVAQAHLKRKNVIALQGERWSLIGNQVNS